MWKSLAVAALVAGSVVGSAQGTYRYTGDVPLDLHKVWFSSYGSFLVFNRFPQGLYLRELHNNSGRGLMMSNSFKVEVVAGGKVVPSTEVATPTEMVLASAQGEVRICFEQGNLIRVHGRGVGLRLTQNEGNFFVEAGKQEWELHGRSRYRFKALTGELGVTQAWEGTHSKPPISVEFRPAASGEMDGYIGDYRLVWDEPKLAVNYGDALAGVKARYGNWVAKMPAVPVKLGAAAEQASYLDWSSTVAKGGFLTRPAMLMSKNWMGSLWSWDNCFNAMALIATNPEAGWDQFMIPFDNQDVSGELPDVMTEEQMSWKHVKPPVQGWVLRWMMTHSTAIDEKKLASVYGPLAKETDWYFKYRDRDHDGLPEYDHGDSSGWDNTTIFVLPPPLEAPDLAALLVVQMDVLAEVAGKLHKPDEAAAWKKRSDTLLALMLKTYWRDGQFVAQRAFDHKEAPTSSLILYLPVILGKRLPEPYRGQLIARLMEKGRFVTANGFATEELSSKYYDPNGYWRGPIWAPTMMMLTDGLEGAGRQDLAQEMRARFCAMAARSGFAENYEPVEGRGSVEPDLEHPAADGRDPSYTWAASVYLIFAHELLTGR